MEKPSTITPGAQEGAEDIPAMSEAPKSPPRPLSRFRRWVLRPAIYLGLLLAAIHYTGRFVTETSIFKILAEERLSASSGMLVSIGDISASGHTGWGVQIEQLVVMDGAKALIHAQIALAELKLSGALRGGVDLAALRLKDARLNLVRGRDGRLNIGQWEGNGPADETIPMKINRLLGALGIVYLENCSLTWTDLMVSEQPAYQLQFHDINLKLGSGEGRISNRELDLGAVALSPKGEGKVRVKGVIHSNGWLDGSPGFDGDVKIDNLDVGHFWPYLGKVLPFQKLDTTAMLDSTISINVDKSFSSKGKVAVRGLDLWYREAYRQGLKARSISVVHDISISGDSITVNKALIDAAPLAIKLEGEAHKLRGDNPEFYVAMDLARVDILELKKYVPFKYLTGVQVGFIENHIFEGDIQITDLTYDGDLRTLEKLDQVESYQSLSGELDLYGLVFTVPGLKRKFADIHGEFILADNRLVFNDLTGRYGHSLLTNVTGMVDQLHKWPTFEAQIVADVDMEETREGLADHVASPEFRRVFNRVESMSGAVGLDLAVAGDSGKMGETFTAEGEMAFSNVGIESASVSAPLTGMNGMVELSLDKVAFEGFEWMIGSSRFAITGEMVDVLKSSPYFDLTIESQLDLEETADYFPVRDKKLERFAGTASAVTTLEGGFDGYRHWTRVDLQDADIIYSDTLFKRPGMEAATEISGGGKVGEMANIDQVLVEMGRSAAEVNGDISRFIRDEKALLKVTSGGVYIDDLDYYTDIFDNIVSKGYIDGDFTVENRGAEGRILLSGAARIVEGTFKLKIFSSIFSECDGDFELVNNQVFLKRGTGMFGKGRFTMFGSVEASDRSEFKLNASTDALDLDDLFGDPNPAVMDRPGATGVDRSGIAPSPGEKKKPGFFNGYWEIIISSDSGELGPLRYENLDTRIEFGDGRYTLYPFTFEGHGGKWSWEAQIIDLRKAIDFRSKVNVRDVAMESLGEQGKERLISGPVNIRGEVNGHGRTWDQVRGTLDGHLDISAGDGVIKRFNLLGKIFSLLNVSQYFKLKLPDLSVEGLPFDSITGSVDLAAGVVYTEDLVVDSEAIRLSAVGSHDLGEDEVDMMIGAMPFVTVDRVISSIPVIGDVIAGADKSFVGYYFRAKGPLDNPDIESVSMEALADGAKGILKRLMSLPTRARETILNKKSGETKK
ncbi:MAG: AsmA-like C-terminal domain-containing protein [Nitrospinota bacterium]|nr:AsmA-like C-terminal domain-containing protein [Nitrospinota bacterium]